MHHLSDKFATPHMVVLTAFLVIVAVMDTSRHRIPNALTVPAAALGLLLSSAHAGMPGLISSAAGLLTGLALFFPFFAARAFGAGDVKALGAVGAFLGPQATLFAAAWILIAGAGGGLLVLMRTGGMASVKVLVMRWAITSSLAMADVRSTRIAPSAGDPALRRFPYGLAIAVGTLTSLLWS